MAARTAGGLATRIGTRGLGDTARDRPQSQVAGPVVQVQKVGRRFGPRTVLHDLDLEVGAGEIVALIGRSGSGKSTLLRALARLDRDITGSVSLDGPFGIAFQDARLLPWKSVLDNVSLGLRVDGSPAAAREALAEVGLEAHADAWPVTLSGGEAQRVSLARALARKPRVLLLDEPFGSLDALTRISMHELLMRLWQRHHPAIVLVTHDVDEALALTDRVLVLGSGRITHESSIGLQRPRDRNHSEMVALRGRLLAELGVTSQRRVDRESGPGSQTRGEEDDENTSYR